MTDDAVAADPAGAGAPSAPRVVRVLPDRPAIDKTFDYLVPDELGDQVRVGTRVRVELHGRRVGGWVVADHVTPPAGVALRPLAKVTGWGPAKSTVELAEWAAWRWAGRTASLLGTASPERAVRVLPPARAGAPAGVPLPEVADPLVRDALDHGRSVLRLPPGADRYPVALGAARLGNALLLVPSVAQARHLAMRLRRAGVEVAVPPRDWAQARAGAVVVGSRAAAWAPVHRLAAVVVFDEHDETFAEERTPTWHARDVAVERARRAGVPCVLVSPTPSLEALAWGRLFTPARAVEREGWPITDVVDMRREDPLRASLYSERLAEVLRSGRRVVCVLNRTGRSRLLACASCGELARCESCDASVVQGDDGSLRCVRCGTVRPQVCLRCGATRMKNLRAGVSRVREELEALARVPVVEVTGETLDEPVPDATVYVGTEAVLHHVHRADVVAFLDLDQELLAPRYRAAEEALALLVRGARLLGPRSSGGRLLLQTRLPQHEVVQAALHGDPGRVASAEAERRELLRFPPTTAMAVVSGAAAGAFVEALGRPLGVEVLGPSEGQWLLRAADHQVLCDALAATPRPPSSAGRLRVEVDPLRL